MLRVPARSLVVLVGPAGIGKTTWALRWFDRHQVVSTDALRGLVGTDERDQAASKDAFALLETVIRNRLRRNLLTVVDSTGLDGRDRARWVSVAAEHGFTPIAVRFDATETEVKARNRSRPRAVPANVVTAQVASAAAIDDDRLTGEGFAVVSGPGPVVLLPRHDPDPDRSTTAGLRFGLHIGRFDLPGGSPDLADRLRETVRLAEDVGFSAISVMDHFIQIPQVGPAWEDIPESTTTLGFLAACTDRARVGVLVNGVTYRNPGHLAKLTATLDVLSGGRAFCGVGAAWSQAEHRAYGWPFPSAGDRLHLLEDTLRLLPVMWGPGNKPFAGRVLTVPDTSCYPRPLQGRIPIIVGGQGERRTLRLAAQWADGCNLFGEPELVRRKLAVLAEHCLAVGRDPEEIEVTHLSTALVGRNEDDTEARIRLVTPGEPRAGAAEALGAGTVADLVRRGSDLAEAGVQTAFVSLPGLWHPGTLERFGEVIAAFA